MATVVVNKPHVIEFKNLDPSLKADEVPTFIAQAGIWQTHDNAGEETGIVLDVSGNAAPLLTPTDARKLARWLTRAADELEGTRTDKKQKKSRRHWGEEDDDDQY